MTRCDPQRQRYAVQALTLAACSLVSAAANAQSNPYVLKASQAFTYDSNLFRKPENEGVRRDLISTTTFGAAIDQQYGRQRYLADAEINGNFYKNNTQFNSFGYDLLLGMDWEAAQRLAGDVRLTSSQTAARFEDFSGQSLSRRNLIRNNALRANGRYGLAGRWSVLGEGGYQSITYSDSRFDDRDYRYGYLGTGVEYRPSDLIRFGLVGRYTDGTYPEIASQGDDFDRRDLELLTTWRPTGLSTVDARISLTSESHKLVPSRDFDGITGNVRWLYRPTAKSRFSVGITRDTRDQGAVGGESSAVGSDSRLTTRFNAAWTWAATAKISVTLDGSYSKDRYDVVGFDRSGPDLIEKNDAGKGSTKIYGLGATYAFSRGVIFECEVSRLNRSADLDVTVTATNYNYKATVAACSAKFSIQ